MRITIQITLAVVILIAGIFIGRMTVNNEKVTDTETKLTDSTELLPAFKETKIGDQIWMVENLNVDTFRDGTKIPEVKTNEEWIKVGEEGQPAWCYYDNDPKNGEKYGKLYNWYAVNDPRGLAPKGWRIPSEYDWEELISAMGGEDVAGKKLKSKTFWEEYEGKSGNGTDDFGFCVFPSGWRKGISSNDLEFVDFNKFAGYWSSTEDKLGISAYTCSFDDNSNYIDDRMFYRGYAISVRCIKDSEPEK